MRCNWLKIIDFLIENVFSAKYQQFLVIFFFCINIFVFKIIARPKKIDLFYFDGKCFSACKFTELILRK